ncbi:MAG TPA: cobaltochelatase subunit CobN, partial [Mycobacterium sp.]|nr:cobaltochelatase subunit CobN [Mycobacterium sp.]
QLSQSYVLDDENRKFMAEANPWALHGMAERLLEAVERGMWAEPSRDTLDGLRRVLLETEGELEG